MFTHCASRRIPGRKDSEGGGGGREIRKGRGKGERKDKRSRHKSGWSWDPGKGPERGHRHLEKGKASKCSQFNFSEIYARGKKKVVEGRAPTSSQDKRGEGNGQVAYRAKICDLRGGGTRSVEGKEKKNRKSGR